MKDAKRILSQATCRNFNRHALILACRAQKKTVLHCCELIRITIIRDFPRNKSL